jgi:transcriptional regulator with XRE-family HTH domain
MGRSRYSEPEIASNLKAYRDSGLTQRQFCSERGISFWTFRTWLSRFRKDRDSHGNPAPVIAFTPSVSVAALSVEYRIRFADETVLHIPSTVSLDTIISSLRAKP